LCPSSRRKPVRWTGFGTLYLCRTIWSQSSINISSYFILICTGKYLLVLMSGKKPPFLLKSNSSGALSISRWVLLNALFVLAHLPVSLRLSCKYHGIFRPIRCSQSFYRFACLTASLSLAAIYCVCLCTSNTIHILTGKPRLICVFSWSLKQLI
jgi:hypothetical protein